MEAPREFTNFAPLIAFDLMHALKIDKATADAIIGNGARESGGFRYGVQIGGGDGVGWWQWSGARHRNFIDYCTTRKMSWRSPSASMSFLIYELRGVYVGALGETIKAHTLYDKTAAFERYFEAAGVPALDDRYEWALMSAHLPAGSHGILFTDTSAQA